MRGVLLAACLCASACGQPPADQAASVPTPEQAALPASAPHASDVEGWETSGTAYARMGSTLPSFTLKQADGTELSQDNLRERWTILAFWSATDDKGEKTYVDALNSAVDQDPDLDLLGVFQLPAAGDATPTVAWPNVTDNGTLASALRVDGTPTYLLVGPDLTIEGYRGALARTPDDGIKSVIRGVAEIRKQIAAPQ